MLSTRQPTDEERNTFSDGHGGSSHGHYKWCVDMVGCQNYGPLFGSPL